MAYTKQNFEDGKVLPASQLNAMEDGIVAIENALSSAINSSSNAITGKLSGTVIAANDVSPVEHYPAVKVRGKNLIVYPYASGHSEQHGITWDIDETDKAIIINGTATQNTSWNVAFQYNKTIALKKGKTYTLSCRSNFTGATGYVYLQNVANGVTMDSASVKNDSQTFVAKADGYANIGVVVLSGKTFNNEKVYIQLEEGDITTDYEPYLDPSSVTVYRHGKNLAYGGTTPSSTASGITVTRKENSSVFTINGTATASISLGATKPILLAPGTYTASVYGLNTVSATFDRCYVYKNSDKAVIVNEIMADKPKSFTLTEPTEIAITFVIYQDSAYSNRVVRLQLECGSVATDWVECKNVVVTGGEATNIISVSPDMTLMTDTANAIVECEYIKDSNAVVGDIESALDSIIAIQNGLIGDNSA